jgi:hypothetical protein
MDVLNSKVKSSQEETLFEAQNVGLYGFDATTTKWRRLAVNANGELEMTAEISTAGLATSANQDTTINATLRDINNTGSIGDGSSNATALSLGYDRTGNAARAILVDSGGKIETNTSINVGHGLATEAKQDDIINATNRGINNTDSIGDGSTNATSVALGYDRSGGKGRAVLVNGSGELMVNLGSSTTQNVNCFGKDGTGTARELLLESNGAFVLGGGSSSALGNTAADGSGTAKYLLTDAAGHLQVDIVSGGGGGGSTTFTIESKSVPDNTLTIIGDNTNAYIDTNGGSRFTISVLSATFTGSPAMNIEWSDNASFSAGKVFICNGYIGGSAITTPVSLALSQRLDGTSMAIQAICAFENIPARYARITIEQTSGGAIVYVGNSVLSP